VVASAPIGGDGRPVVLPILQRVSASEVAARPLLPSCLYAPLEGEVGPRPATTPGVDPPWESGEWAKKRGAEVPGRLVISAKSWLGHAGVDRTAPILPYGEVGEGVVPLSPVEASAQILRHVRRAWELSFPGYSLADQLVVLTVPASFDEAARGLTVEATRLAGLGVVLLEEPQAAFHDWMQRQGDEGLAGLLRGRSAALVLVCDVGGGTTDLSLIRVEAGADGPRVVRVAVGDHLLLGGDNMDLALAHRIEGRLSGEGAAPGKLGPARFAQLVAACRATKERLLGDDPPDEATVTLLGEGSRLLGGARRARVTRAEAEELLLDGFFPVVPADARPVSRSGLVAFGLPHARDSAITRHLAWFLARHGEDGPARPDALVLNGGVFHGRAIAERLARVLGAWAGVPPRLLPFADPDLAVARGAVAYGLAQLGQGRRIEGGSARAYYVGLGPGADGVEQAVCVLPQGARPGERHRAPIELALVLGKAARFELLASAETRHEQPGDLVTIDDEAFHRLPPIATRLEPRAGVATEVPVQIEAELSEVGTLELACVERNNGPRHQLAFQLRDASPPSSRAPGSMPPPSRTPGSMPPPSRPPGSMPPPSRPPGSIPPPSRAPGSLPSSMLLGVAVPPAARLPRRIEEARALLQRVYGKAAAPASPREVKDLVRDLEKLLGERASWSLDVARPLFDALFEVHRGRRRSPDHERQFWSLAGYTLRPGFGDLEDTVRVQRIYPLCREGVQHAREPRAWQQFWIAWRRVAGGLDEATQLDLRDRTDAILRPDRKRIHQESIDEVEAAACWLERAPVARKVALGGWLVERSWVSPDARLWENLGRLGARVPAYGSAHAVVPPATAEGWVEELLRASWPQTPTAPLAAYRLARVTGDRARDLGERPRREVARRLESVGANPAWVQGVRELVEVGEAERREAFGEALPVGLRLLDPPG
jgi:hypothetical protein